MMTIPNDDHPSLTEDDAAAAVAAANSAVGTIPHLKEEEAQQLHQQYVQHQQQFHPHHQSQQHHHLGHAQPQSQPPQGQIPVQASSLPPPYQVQQHHQQQHHLHQQHIPQQQHLHQPLHQQPHHHNIPQAHHQQHQQLQQHLAQLAQDHHQHQHDQDQINVQLSHSLNNHHQYQQQQQHQQQQHLHHQQLQQQQLQPHHQLQPQQPQQPQQQQQQQQQSQRHIHHPLNHGHLGMLAPTNEAELIETPNRKVAPRSSDLFKVGPTFSETRHHQDIYCKRNDMDVNPILEARIDRGFEIGENGTWIGYKRNYFTLVTAFTLENFDFDRFMENKFYTFEKASSRNGEPVGESKVEISYFAIRLVAKCSDDDVSISLIQHTAKRDKGPQFPPPIYPAVPGDLPDHDTVKASCNKRNGSKIENMNKIFYFDRGEYYHDTNLDTLKDESILKNYPSDSIARVARFERIQFTSSIRIKSTSINSRYFTLHVELLGIIEDEDLQIQPILLSSIETPPLIIRGRSPSNYHKERTSGYRGHGHMGQA